MKKFIIPVIVLFFISFSAVSQIHNVYIGSGSSSLYLSSTPDVHGNAFPDRYMNTDWKKGSVITRQSTMLNNVGLRYNISKGQFEIVSVLNPSVVKRINLDGKVFVHTRFLDEKGQVKSAYFQLLSEGETRFLIRRTVSRKQGKKGLYGYDAYETVKETYYIQKGKHPAVEVKRNKKSILAVLSDEEKPLDEWLRKHSISFYKTTDVARLLKYYNRLKSASDS